MEMEMVYVAIFEATVHFTMYIIMCPFPFQQDLYPKLKVIFLAGELFYILFLRNILLISVISMKNNTKKNTASFVLTVSWMLVNILLAAAII